MSRVLPSDQWYIEEDQHTKRGPYTTEQIQALFEQGDIQADTRIVHPGEAQEYQTVMDLLKSRTDPDYTLFDVLQTAREHKASKKENGQEPSLYSFESTPSNAPRGNDPVKLGILVVSTLVSMGLTWAFFQSLMKSPPTPPPSVLSTEGTATPSSSRTREGIGEPPKSFQPPPNFPPPQARPTFNNSFSRPAPIPTRTEAPPPPEPTATSEPLPNDPVNDRAPEGEAPPPNEFDQPIPAEGS